MACCLQMSSNALACNHQSILCVFITILITINGLVQTRLIFIGYFAHFTHQCETLLICLPPTFGHTCKRHCPIYTTVFQNGISEMQLAKSTELESYKEK